MCDVASGAIERLTSTSDLDSRPSWSPDGRRLVFQSDRDGGMHLWILSLDDLSVRQLTSGEWIEGAPHWSPRGDWITYVSQAAGTGGWDVWVIRPDGTGARAVTSHPGNEYHPKFSPDGARITFYPTWEKWTDIAVVDLEGSEARNILSSEHADFRPDWSPDGRTIVFASARNGEGGLWTVPAAGGSATRLVGGPHTFDFPDWSPDGGSILYQQTVENALLFETSLDGEVTQLTHGAGAVADLYPDVSEDGLLAYQNNRHGNEDNVVVRGRAGGRERRLSTGRTNDGHARFSPSGTRVAFIQSGGDQAHSELFVVGTAGGAPERWTRMGNVAFPTFCDETTIAFLQGEVAYSGEMRLWLQEEGGRPRRVGDVVLRREGIDCSPDGRTVVATLATGRDGEGGSPLVRIDVATGRASPMTRGGFEDLQPRISRDGRRVAFVSKRDPTRPPGIYVVSLEGPPDGPRDEREPTHVLTTDRAIAGLAWSGADRLIFSGQLRVQSARLHELPIQ